MAKWYDDTGFQGDIVLSTRVRLARNLKGIPFPNKMSDDDAKKVVELVSGALENMNYGFTRLDLNAMSKTEKQKLVEKRYISPDLAKQTKPCAVFISDDESVSIMVNEEEHIRMQSIFAGLECQKAYDIISKIDAYLAEKLEYAVHPKYGYLTSCLTNLGTGMRVSCMLHLPAVCLCSVADSMFATLGKLGITVRGMYGLWWKPRRQALPTAEALLREMPSVQKLYVSGSKRRNNYGYKIYRKFKGGIAPRK